jgi:hypothetical protein
MSTGPPAHPSPRGIPPRPTRTDSPNVVRGTIGSDGDGLEGAGASRFGGGILVNRLKGTAMAGAAHDRTSDPPPRRSGRFKLSLRAALLAVLAIGLACGALARSYHQRLRREAALARLGPSARATNAVLHQAQADLVDAGRGVSGVRITGNGSDRAWGRELEVWTDTPTPHRTLLHLDVRGDVEDESIRITDFGAPLNARAVDRLVGAYRARGWRYRIVRRQGGSPDPP